MIWSLLLVIASSSLASAEPVRVGSKAFTEGYLLGELTAQTLTDAGFEVERNLGIGATGIAALALQNGSVDILPEYSGTIAQELLHRPDLKKIEDLEEPLHAIGLRISRPLGVQNNYALAVTPAFAKEHQLETISDLKKVTKFLRVGFSHEFLSRSDGYFALANAYHLDLPPPQAMDHVLVYRAAAAESVNLLDVYSTDAKVDTLHLKLLKDDLHYFPTYEAVLLAREAFIKDSPQAWDTARRLEGSLTNEKIRAMNAAVDEKGESFQAVIHHYLGHAGEPESKRASNLRMLWMRTKEHVRLVGIAFLLSMFAGVPLGIVAAYRPRLGHGILLGSGMLQTIPSLALLCFLIPLFGIGLGSSLVALFLYGLLPVVTNTLIGLKSIEPGFLEMSQALGLSPWQSLYRVELPLASRSILAGLRTSAVISIGTATLAALIGAGGYGAIIVAGLAVNDTSMILLGAAPAAALALLMQGGFSVLDRVLVPKGLR